MTLRSTATLAPHCEVANLCRKGIIDAGIDPEELEYEIGLSELGEWMNFRIYLPDRYEFVDDAGNKLGLRLECFNSVDGSARLVIVFGWLRFVCSNGLVIGEIKIEIKEKHGERLDLAEIAARIQPALNAALEDGAKMTGWQSQKVEIEAVASWADNQLAEKWGKKPPRACFISATLARTSSWTIRLPEGRYKETNSVPCFRSWRAGPRFYKL